jgi:hypothetical protein
MQNGSVIRAERQRGPDVWEFRWREPDADGKSVLRAWWKNTRIDGLPRVSMLRWTAAGLNPEHQEEKPMKLILVAFCVAAWFAGLPSLALDVAAITCAYLIARRAWRVFCAAVRRTPSCE